MSFDNGVHGEVSPSRMYRSTAKEDAMVEFDPHEPPPPLNGPTQHVVRWLRLFCNLDVSELAARAEISPDVLDRYERSFHTLATPDLLKLVTRLRTATHLRCVAFKENRREPNRPSRQRPLTPLERELGERERRRDATRRYRAKMRDRALALVDERLAAERHQTASA
jgi:hypothetical protein